MKLLGTFIQVEANPPIFYMPARHTLRTLELQKATKKKYEGELGHLLKRVGLMLRKHLRADKITTRRAELEKDITALDEKMHAREARAKGEEGGEL